MFRKVVAVFVLFVLVLSSPLVWGQSSSQGLAL